MDYQLNRSDHRKTYNFRGIGWNWLVFLAFFSKERARNSCGNLSFYHGCGDFWLGCWFILTWFTAFNAKTPMYLWAGSFIAGIILSILFERKAIPAIENLVKTGTKKSVLERGGKTDIRELLKTYQKI